MGYILFIIASILKWILTPFAYTYGIIISISKKEFNEWHRTLAIAKDQYGNVLCKYLFNSVLIKKGGIMYGNEDETISSVTGKNEKKGTLTILGRILTKTLGKIEYNHSIKSIEEDEIDEVK